MCLVSPAMSSKQDEYQFLEHLYKFQEPVSDSREVCGQTSLTSYKRGSL